MAFNADALAIGAFGLDKTFVAGQLPVRVAGAEVRARLALLFFDAIGVVNLVFESNFVALNYL